jgi:hypothetical protein
MQPTPHDYGIWLLIFTSFVGLLSSFAVIYATFRTQRREVSMKESFATVTELNRVEERVDGVDGDLKALKEAIVSNGETRRKSIEAKVEAVRLEVKEDTTELHTKVNGVATEVAAVKAQCDLTNQSMVQLTGQITTLIQRRNA